MDKQVMEMIGDIEIPVIVDDMGEKWYPFNGIYRKVLGKEGLSGDVYKKYSEYISNKHISEAGLIAFVEKLNSSIFTKPQKKKLNILREFLGLERLEGIDGYVNKIPKEDIEKYSAYEMSLIEEYSEDKSPYDLKFAQCSQCKMYYPMDTVFYIFAHDRYETHCCRKCNPKLGGFSSKNDKTNFIKNLFEESEIMNVTNEMLYLKAIKTYNTIPERICDKEFILDILNYYKSKFPKYKFKDMSNTAQLQRDTRLQYIYKHFTIYDIIDMWYGEDARYQPFKYGFCLSGDYPRTKESLMKMFRYYIEFAKISMEEYDLVCDEFSIFIRKYKMPESEYISKLDFIVEFYEYKIPGYKFKANGQKYYDCDKNVLFDFKKLVEEMNLEIPKIPIYITKNILNTKYKPLYRALMANNKNSFNTLFDIFNAIYPNQFVELDFDRNFKREEFDSVEEKEVHDYLSDRLGKNLIYNIRDGSTGIKINGSMPDWILIKEKPVIIEYFGLTIENRETNNKRVNDYKEKTERKINAYRELECYDTLFIYPSDIKNNFEKLEEKLIEMELI